MEAVSVSDGLGLIRTKKEKRRSQLILNTNPTNQVRNLWIGVVFFMLAIPPGLWGPALPNILAAHDALWAMPYATAIGPLVSIVSSLVFSSIADRRMEAQKLMAILSVSGALFLYLAFLTLSLGWSPWWYVGLQSINTMISAPLWALLTKIALVNLKCPEKQFPLYRMWATVGWIVAGVAVSWLQMDSSTSVGQVGAVIRMFVGMTCLMLPVTLPSGRAANNWKESLGIEAFSLFKYRSLRVYFITSMIFAIPLASHYMYTAKVLNELSDAGQGSGVVVSLVTWLLPGPAAQMTLGQLTEIAAMLIMSWLGVRAKVKPLVMIALGFGILRFVLYALSGYTGLITWMWLGALLHGPCYTFFSITGQLFVDRRVPGDMRGQAQALLGLLSGSIGNTVGALACGALFTVTGAGMSFMAWTIFWAILAVSVVFCLGYFLLGYRGVPSDE